jgi:hypothetical protein
LVNGPSEHTMSAVGSFSDLRRCPFCWGNRTSGAPSALIYDQQIFLHRRDWHIQRGIAIARSRTPSQRRGALQGDVPRHPSRQFLRRNQLGHLITSLSVSKTSFLLRRVGRIA